MSAEEFLRIAGRPENVRSVTSEEIKSALGRIPDELLEFYVNNGIGSYARELFWLCMPSIIDPILDKLLIHIPELRGRLAAFAYDAKGVIYLWHMAGRHYVLYLPFGAIDDQTSRRETAPVPYDLADLFRAAGLEYGPEAEAEFLATRNTPEDIWSILLSGASIENYASDLGEELQSLPFALKEKLGALEYGEIYCRIPDRAENAPASFERMKLVDSIRLLPESTTISRAIEKDGAQVIIETAFPNGSLK